MIRVESDGSFWLIDDDRQQYLRMPKTEQPRVNHSGYAALDDLVWHPFNSWHVTSCRGHDALHIAVGEDRICAPMSPLAIRVVGLPREPHV